MPNSLRTSFISAAYYRMAAHLVLPRLQAWGLTPNRITWLGLSISVIVPLGFWVHPVWGFLFMAMSGMADSLDGLLARRLNSVSPWGAFLDSILDRASDFFYLMGFWVMLWKNTAPVPATLSFSIIALLTLLISYAKARAEALGFACPVGLMERGARVIYLMAWALVLIAIPSGAAAVLWIGLVGYGASTLMTVFQRGLYIRRQMTNCITGNPTHTNALHTENKERKL